MRILNLTLGISLVSSITLFAKVIDTRQEVKFPIELKKHTLHNMRDHLKALYEILDALGKDNIDRASEISESRLGMSSMRLHGANRIAPYMPMTMRKMGVALHHASSKFALVVQEENPQKTYKALSKITASCIACHAQFKLK